MSSFGVSNMKQLSSSKIISASRVSLKMEDRTISSYSFAFFSDDTLNGFGMRTGKSESSDSRPVFPLLEMESAAIWSNSFSAFSICSSEETNRR